MLSKVSFLLIFTGELKLSTIIMDPQGTFKDPWTAHHRSAQVP